MQDLDAWVLQLSWVSLECNSGSGLGYLLESVLGFHLAIAQHGSLGGDGILPGLRCASFRFGLVERERDAVKDGRLAAGEGASG
jgi:hypothetical protein